MAKYELDQGLILENPLKTDFFASSPVSFFDKENKEVQLSFHDIIQKLENLVTEERLDKLNEVINNRTDNFVSILENIYDRGNVSAVMRSAEAFGFHNMHIIEQKSKAFKTSSRVTQGADKWLNVSIHETAKSSVESLKAKGFQIFATHLDAAQPISEIDFSIPTALVFGNEREGVSKEMLDLIDGAVIIPMQGFSQSFNISVAGALSFYHAYLNRMERMGCNGDLTEDQKQRLLANYLFRSVKNPLACMVY
ncbi:MAG: RNA methyltransferase [Bdellovibrionaceae bacterium]|jgi:tRNA (guanosine-2'-O-)-methyltransferase|nr:RNA methyltransferase [Pseudobdellovibrionaceae bacterium]